MKKKVSVVSRGGNCQGNEVLRLCVLPMRQLSKSRGYSRSRLDIQFCKCILIVGPFGALLIQIYKSFPFLASKNITLLQL